MHFDGQQTSEKPAGSPRRGPAAPARFPAQSWARRPPTKLLPRICLLLGLRSSSWGLQEQPNPGFPRRSPPPPAAAKAPRPRARPRHGAPPQPPPGAPRTRKGATRKERTRRTRWTRPLTRPRPWAPGVPPSPAFPAPSRRRPAGGPALHPRPPAGRVPRPSAPSPRGPAPTRCCLGAGQLGRRARPPAAGDPHRGRWSRRRKARRGGGRVSSAPARRRWRRRWRRRRSSRFPFSPFSNNKQEVRHTAAARRRHFRPSLTPRMRLAQPTPPSRRFLAARGAAGGARARWTQPRLASRVARAGSPPFVSVPASRRPRFRSGTGCLYFVQVFLGFLKPSLCYLPGSKRMSCEQKKAVLFI